MPTSHWYKNAWNYVSTPTGLALSVTLGSVLAVSTAGYFIGRDIGKTQAETHHDEISLETRDKELEGKVYTSIEGEYFLHEGRTGISLKEMEKRTVGKLNKAHETKKSESEKKFSKKASETNSKYDTINKNATQEARKAWGLEVPAVRPAVIRQEPRMVRTNLFEAILGLEKEYDSIANKSGGRN